MSRAFAAFLSPSLASFFNLTRFAPVNAVSVSEKNAEQTTNTTMIQA